MAGGVDIGNIHNESWKCERQILEICTETTGNSNDDNWKYNGGIGYSIGDRCEVERWKSHQPEYFMWLVSEQMVAIKVDESSDVELCREWSRTFISL